MLSASGILSYFVDEVSENEKISTSSVPSSSIDSSVSIENAKEKSITDALRIDISSPEKNLGKEENQMCKLDSDLLEYNMFVRI